MNTELSTAALAPDNYSYHERQWRAPSVPEGHRIIFDEPGRVLGPNGTSVNGSRNATDYRSHYFRVTVGKHGDHVLRVKHGGGEEEVHLGYGYRGVDHWLGMLDSDSRYLLLFGILDVYHKALAKGVSDASREYRSAFAEGRLKKRKLPRSNEVKVWIEPQSVNRGL